MWEFLVWSNKTQLWRKTKLCYIDRDSFIVHIKKDVYADIAKYVETSFDTSNYEVERHLFIRKTTVIGSD